MKTKTIIIKEHTRKIGDKKIKVKAYSRVVSNKSTLKENSVNYGERNYVIGKAAVTNSSAKVIERNKELLKRLANL